MKGTRISRNVAALVAGMVVTAGAAHATTVKIDMGQAYWSNSATPTQSGPWMTATFEQAGTDTVKLTLNRMLSDPNVSINRWMFNLDPGMNANELQINQVGGPQANVLTAPNGVAAAGGSMFDIRFFWPAHGQKFDGNHSQAVFTLQGEGLTPDSFRWGSTGGHPTATNFVSVAWLHDVNGTGQTWVTHPENSPSVVPLPPAVFAGAAGLALVGFHVRRRRSS
jgi:hypothetical protein